MPRSTDQTASIRFLWDAQSKAWTIIGRLEQFGQRPVVLVRSVDSGVPLDKGELTNLLRACQRTLESADRALFE